jgi:hypothetical protein
MYFASALQIRRGGRTVQAHSTTLTLAPQSLRFRPARPCGSMALAGSCRSQCSSPPAAAGGLNNILAGFPVKPAPTTSPKNASSRCTHLRPSDGCEPTCQTR